MEEADCVKPDKDDVVKDCQEYDETGECLDCLDNKVLITNGLGSSCHEVDFMTSCNDSSHSNRNITCDECDEGTYRYNSTDISICLDLPDIPNCIY